MITNLLNAVSNYLDEFLCNVYIAIECIVVSDSVKHTILGTVLYNFSVFIIKC